MTTRILLADDHAVLRAGLHLLLENQPGLEVVGEASSGLEALDLALKLSPDLILLDLSMPGLGGLDALPALRKSVPSARVLILTMHDDPQYLRQALKQGASGYVLKKAADQELLSAVRAVLRGDVYIQPSMTRVLLDDMLMDTPVAVGDTWETLSEREQTVLKLVVLGYTGAEIGEQLNLSIKTVDTYRMRGLEKLGLSSRAALVRFALKKGLISAE
ncbi:MAG: DNA-binding response regulator [Anaerolineae bacterium CG_4_9_14_3_um_filter_57_17]|nr:response regulator transcription factor [bacterium]NCT19985.1 response regulator transcription factor [bacterium]OIO84947.1 MAG: DNA-binding response regulator [Anaerolineae bacterium CG2_30_57_67]PJB64081.1 MAG: DNA-binding response regulator [Anaerolineae bacterium CG_4_9_14_3_um_filter_57_17]